MNKNRQWVVYATYIASQLRQRCCGGRLTDLKATRRYCRHQQPRPVDVTFQVEEGPIHDSAHHDIGVVLAELDQVILRRSGQWQ